ncbi:hypothetical protein [Duganella sacchari]|nr:hypothetical protein [Duganella sacchari]
MSKQYEQIIAQLALFQKKQDLPALSQAISLAAALPNDASAVAPSALLTDKLSAWLAIFGALDSEIAPDFNPEALPQMTVIPPPESGLPAGASPDSIKDPAVRKKYEEALSANKLSTQRFNYQFKLAEQAERAEAEAEDFIATAWLPDPALTAALKARLGKAKLVPARRTKLQEFINAAKGS